jgi:hypothetical protein
MSQRQEDFMAKLFMPPPEAASGPDGVDIWRAQRADLIKEQAQKNTLPIGEYVRVEFASGDPLEGWLHFAEERLFWDAKKGTEVELRIGKATFSSREIVSWVRVEHPA